jgi:endonuclease/exonuclease/phosphatase family metal-dependent hydrolase
MIMGDFNSKPDTPLYRFMRQGAIDCLKHHRKDMAGAFAAQPHVNHQTIMVLVLCMQASN